MKMNALCQRGPLAAIALGLILSHSAKVEMADSYDLTRAGLTSTGFINTSTDYQHSLIGAGALIACTSQIAV